MDRRAFLRTLAGGLLAAPAAAKAQEAGRIRRVGVLHVGSPPDPWVEGFRQGLRELGYVEDRNIAVEYRWAQGQMDRLPELAAELIQRRVQVAVTMAGPAVFAVKQQSATIPIVMAVSGDPVGLGLVPSLGRPGGNITGFSLMSSDLAAKRLQVLKDAVLAASHVAVLFNPAEPPTGPELKETQTAAEALGVAISPLPARAPEELDGLFTRATHEGANGLITFARGGGVWPPGPR